ncbi:MAG TPA: hypothetical protein VLD19_05210, partial [Chitinophagaceae bacterium]|nr:hypothetical protein [Chitinophagaceae bacterium]
MNPATTFQQWLPTAFLNGPWATDEVVAFVLPLFEEVQSFHENGLVGSFERPDSIFLTNNRLDIDEQFAHAPLRNARALKPLLEHQQVEGFSVTERLLVDDNISEQQRNVANLEVEINPNTEFTRPVFLPGYGSYE